MFAEIPATLQPGWLMCSLIVSGCVGWGNPQISHKIRHQRTNYRTGPKFRNSAPKVVRKSGPAYYKSTFTPFRSCQWNTCKNFTTPTPSSTTMLRHRRTQQPKLKLLDGPPELTPVDAEIARHQGSSVAIDTSQKSLQAAKKMPTASLSQTVEELTRENGRLREELAYWQRRDGASLYLLGEVKDAVGSLQQAIVNFQRINREDRD